MNSTNWINAPFSKEDVFKEVARVISLGLNAPSDDQITRTEMQTLLEQEKAQEIVPIPGLMN